MTDNEYVSTLGLVNPKAIKGLKAYIPGNHGKPYMPIVIQRVWKSYTCPNKCMKIEYRFDVRKNAYLEVAFLETCNVTHKVHSKIEIVLQ